MVITLLLFLNATAYNFFKLLRVLREFFLLNFSKNKLHYQVFYNVLGFCPGKLKLYQISLTHHSYKHLQRTKGAAKLNNERLEYLGDSVFGFIVAEKLYNLYPYQDEGFLTEMRSKIVNRQRLNTIGKKMGLQVLLKYDKKLERESRFMDTMTGNAFEALIGAIYIDKGYKFTRNYILTKIIDSYIDFKVLIDDEISYKARLTKWAQREHKKLEFIVKNIEILNKHKLYEIAVLIDGEEVILNKNHSKKSAEEIASEKLCLAMKIPVFKV